MGISESNSEFSTTVYKILYKDGSPEFYEEDDDELAEIVENAAEPQIYPIGVEIYEYFEEDSEDSEEYGEGWYMGFISDFDLETRNYTVTFDADNSTEYFGPEDMDNLTMLVDNVYEIDATLQEMEEELDEEGER